MPHVQTPTDLAAWRTSLGGIYSPGKITLVISNSTCAQASHSVDIIEAAEQAIERRGLGDRVEVRTTGCHGFCQIEPLILVAPGKTLYPKLQVKDVDAIVEAAAEGRVIEERTWKGDDGAHIATEDLLPFYAKQNTMISGASRWVDPLRIETYIAGGGYEALAKAYAMTPEAVIEEIKASGLRGRGGGGFATGRKWESCRKAKGYPKYVVCNADEGDPGAYMDRALLEGNPHLIIEGMLIAAHAIGSDRGFVYVRHEYPVAVHNLIVAIDQAREAGFLGKNILGSGHDFDIDISRGGGAFVCGESTALMASIEGKPGEPRAKYVHTVEHGLWNLPTNLNNVETYGNVPWIVTNGAAEYAKIGTEGSKGTKIFSLVGKVRNTGLVEVPMGITLREIVEDVGGGVPDGKRFKAVQTGGPSGGCIPAAHLDLQVDFDRLWDVGSIMGSGGMIVMDDDNCMVDIARYFTKFLMEESCGKCTPCREGIRHLHRILCDIADGKGREGDIELLESMSEAIMSTSICGLGQSAPIPLLSTIRYFREEYEAHIRERRCPSGVCKELVSYRVIEEKCTGCTLCLRSCPTESIQGSKKVPHRILKDNCIKCGACETVCKFDAIVHG